MLQYRDCMKTLMTRMDTGIYVGIVVLVWHVNRVTELIHTQAGRYHSLTT